MAADATYSSRYGTIYGAETPLAPWNPFTESPANFPAVPRCAVPDSLADAGADAGAGYPDFSMGWQPTTPGSHPRFPAAGDDDEADRQVDECLEGLFNRSTAPQSSVGTGGPLSSSGSRTPGGGGGAGSLPFAPLTSPGTRQHQHHGLAPSHAAGVRHIAGWLRASTHGMGGSEVRRAKLRTEYQELWREHREERLAAEELQVRLSTEMRELRDQCQEQGTTVGMLAQRLADARGAVTAELRGAAAVRTALGGELMSEESQRRALEAARRGEEMEIAGRVEAAEQQLSTMQGVRASLEAQLRASVKMQADLREHIAAERGGRAELEVAGERELVAWSEHNDRVCGELRSRLQCERAEVETWRASTTKEVSRLQEECERNGREESRLLERLQHVRERQASTRTKLRAEVVAWHREVEVLRVRVREADEEHARTEDSLRRQKAALGACGVERLELTEELQEKLGQTREGVGELQTLERLTGEMREELRELRAAAQRCRADQEADLLRQERDELIPEVQAEERRQQELREELDCDRKSWGLPCMRRRMVPPADFPVVTQLPPRGPPPVPPPRHTQAAATPSTSAPSATSAGSGGAAGRAAKPRAGADRPRAAEGGRGGAAPGGAGTRGGGVGSFASSSAGVGDLYDADEV